MIDIATLDDTIEQEVQSRLSSLPPVEKKKAVPKSEPPVRPFIIPVESYRGFELLLGKEYIQENFPSGVERTIGWGVESSSLVEKMLGLYVAPREAYYDSVEMMKVPILAGRTNHEDQPHYRYMLTMLKDGKTIKTLRSFKPFPLGPINRGEYERIEFLLDFLTDEARKIGFDKALSILESGVGYKIDHDYVGVFSSRPKAGVQNLRSLVNWR